MADSPARAFGTVYRRFQEAANRGYATRGWKGLMLSHVQFLCETEETGTRLSDVASALKTTKQYAGRLARDMAAKRLVTLVADPLDRRAVLAKPTERGRAFLQVACEVRAELEARYLSRLSPSRAAAFVATLKELVAATEA
ncbi:MAG: MarR family winged helix-turn-helix transcriptional regulator [Gemmatimonadales bacterium]